MGDAEIQEAAAASGLITVFSNYLASTEHGVDKLKEELDAASEYIKSRDGRD